MSFYTSFYQFVCFLRFLKSTVRGQKKPRKSISISQRLFIILPNALGSKEAKYPSFFQKIFEYPFPPLRYFFYSFLICGVLKKAIFPLLRSKMTITPNFLTKIIQDFLYRYIWPMRIFDRNF